MRHRRICVITGTRAEYGLLSPIMRLINKSSNLKLLLMVTGTHLSDEFGRTLDLIKKDGFNISYRIAIIPKGDNAASMALAVGAGIIRITNAFINKRPDITLILGDRVEALAGAIASSYLNIPVAHIHGGDKTMAGLDESARHAITKMAHIHFAASELSRRRIIRMGERPDNVYLTGAPGLDTIMAKKLFSRQDLGKIINLDCGKGFLVLLQHSVTSQIDEAGKQIKETIAAINKSGMNTVVIYPNSDAGGREIIKEIEKISRLPNMRIFKNIPHLLYLSLLKYASLLIGNSSSGIIESAVFKLPVINIGIRQNGRERSTNVIDVPHDRNAILHGIKYALIDKKFREKIKRCKSPYGSGHASESIVRVLSKIQLNKELLQKQITY